MTENERIANRLEQIVWALRDGNISNAGMRETVVANDCALPFDNESDKPYKSEIVLTFDDEADKGHKYKAGTLVNTYGTECYKSGGIRGLHTDISRWSIDEVYKNVPLRSATTETTIMEGENNG